MAIYLRHPSSFAHDTGPHPENAGRLRAIEEELSGRDWLGLELVEAPAATREQLERVHTAEHVASIEAFCAAGGGNIDLDTIAVPASFEAALRAAGGAVHAVDRMLGGDERLAFCGLRPPGHHAEADRAMGFCLFNNVAAAAAHALAEHGAERVLVLDWDVHHGNGTEAIFLESDRVLYASIHQSPLYPGTGSPGEVGRGAGEGYTVNLPVPPGSGSEEFLSLVQGVVVPIARAWRPRLVAISAGFDAHRSDPLAECVVEEGGYRDMAASMRELAAELSAPVLVCLEGGYDPAALATSVAATIEGLGDGASPRAASGDAAAEPRARLAPYWPELH